MNRGSKWNFCLHLIFNLIKYRFKRFCHHWIYPHFKPPKNEWKHLSPRFICCKHKCKHQFSPFSGYSSNSTNLKVNQLLWLRDWWAVCLEFSKGDICYLAKLHIFINYSSPTQDCININTTLSNACFCVWMRRCVG